VPLPGTRPGTASRSPGTLCAPASQAASDLLRQIRTSEGGTRQVSHTPHNPATAGTSTRKEAANEHRRTAPPPARTARLPAAGKASVGTYLYVIARSVAADIRKRPSSRPLRPVDDADVPPQPDSVDGILDSMIIREAVETLGPAHAEVIRLAQEGLTQPQIAELLGLPVGTVKTRTYHGVRALRTALIERGFHAV